MNIKKVIKLYLTICGHKGLKNNNLKCQCGVDDLMKCYTPLTTCEIWKVNND